MLSVLSLPGTWAGKIGETVTVPATKPEDLGLNHRPHMVGEKMQTHRLSSDLHSQATCHTYIQLKCAHTCMLINVT